MKIRIGIVGVTGYSGQELLRILRGHPNASVNLLASLRLKKPTPLGELVPGCPPEYRSRRVAPFRLREAARCQALFLSLPHGVAMGLADRLLRRNDELRIVDLSGDFRLRSPRLFAQAYRLSHRSQRWLGQAAYGLTEWNRDPIRESRLIANPGCYPTAALLALGPLAEAGWIDPQGIVVDAKSGVTGAGRSLRQDLLFSEVNEDLRAYKVNAHPHIPEMEQQLTRWAGRASRVTFVPHLIPMNRGLYATVYARLRRPRTESRIRRLYQRRYGQEPFIRILPEGSFPQTRAVAGTNDCEIGIRLDRKNRQAILLAAIDNLGKGAAGQAVQNMNLCFGLPEGAGLMAGGAGR